MQHHLSPFRTRRQPPCSSAAWTLILSTLLLLGTAVTPRAASALLLDLPFNEGSFFETANAGHYGGIGYLDPGVGGPGEFPRFSTSVPEGPWAPAGNQASVDFGMIASDEGGRGIDFLEAGTGFGDATPASGLLRFTVAGWINLHSTEIGPGGNRIVSTWPNGSTATLGSGRQRGIDLVVVSDSTPSATTARLRLGVNAAPDQDLQGPYSSNGKVRVGQWVFFAVTYDNGQAAYYFGDGNTPAALDVTAAYNRQGVVNSGMVVAVGNFQPAGGNQTIRYAPGPGSRVLRGMLDELEVYAQALTLEEVQAVQTNGTIAASLPAVVVEPAGQSVLAGQEVTFTVSANGTPPLTYMWQRDGQDIWDSSGPRYTLPAAAVTDNGAQFRVIVTDAIGEATSANATLTVAADTTPPSVVAVETTSKLNTLRVIFSKPVDAATAENALNYELMLGAEQVATMSAELMPSLTEVLLTTAPMTPDAMHTLKIMNVRDRALPPNTMAAFEQTFTAYNPPPRTEPLIEVRFEEGAGTTVANGGRAGGTGTIDLGLTSSASGLPSFLSNVPAGDYAPSGNLYSLYTGTGAGHAQYAGKAVDFPYAVTSTTVGLEEFTVTGWINVTDGTIGGGGNRIIGTWANNANNVADNRLTGFDVVVESNGRLRLGVNQAPDYPTPPGNIGPTSSTGRVPASAGADQGNWVFFAITYDTALSAENVQFYFGDGSTPAAKDMEATLVDYNRGAIADATVERELTLANFVAGTPNDAAVRDSTSNSRAFRGLMDEIRFFANALTLEEIQAVQIRGGEIVILPPEIVSQPANASVFEGAAATFNVGVIGTPPITVRWQRNGEDIPDATGVTYTLPAVTAADDGAVFRAIATNDHGSDTSDSATLTVLPEDGLKLRFAFEEGSGSSTANLGNLEGRGNFALQTDYPVFSSNVPLGTYAPSPNAGSVDFGTITTGQGGRAIDWGNGITPTLGAMHAFTAAGWLNARDLTIGFGGNRIVFALDAPNGRGFDLVQLDSGALRLGVNQWPDGANGGGPVSSVGMITADPDAGPDNWVFFAATYDSMLPGGQVKYYFGTPEFPVALDTAHDYDRGTLAASGPATLGNFGLVVGARTDTASSRVFRGLMDEISIFNRALTLEEIALLQVTAHEPPARTDPLIEVRFEEGSGATVANTGTAGGTGTIDFGLASSTPDLPGFVNNVPAGPFAPSGNLYSLNTGAGAGHAPYAGKAVDFPYAVKSSTHGLAEFTVSGWINVTDGTVGGGGNRIIGTWPNNADNVANNRLTGFDVVVAPNGTLRLGVNQAPDFPTPPGNIGPTSSTGKVTVSAEAAPGNWVFFAITYDAALESENVQFFFGNGSAPAAKDTGATLVNYNRGAIADASVERELTLANFVAGTPNDGGVRDSASNSRAFRGLMDEIRFFASALTLEEIQQAQTGGGVAPGPVLSVRLEGGQAVISWSSAAALELVYKDRLDDANWTPVTETVETAGNLHTVRVNADQATRFYSLVQ